MAIARGSAAASDQMVICTGHGFITIYTDANGAPTSAPHICPDCILSLHDCAEQPSRGLPAEMVCLTGSTWTAVFATQTAVSTGFYSRAPPKFA
ncbi:MAG: hypothetical protein AAF665_18795 [Pseudomonadota bacterium]